MELLLHYSKRASISILYFSMTGQIVNSTANNVRYKQNTTTMSCCHFFRSSRVNKNTVFLRQNCNDTFWTKWYKIMIPWIFNTEQRCAPQSHTVIDLFLAGIPIWFRVRTRLTPRLCVFRNCVNPIPVALTNLCSNNPPIPFPANLRTLSAAHLFT